MLKELFNFLMSETQSTFAQCILRAAAIASLARTTDFAANSRLVDWLITHPSEVMFTADTLTVIIVLKTNHFSITIVKQELIRRCSAYCVGPRCPVSYRPSNPAPCTTPRG